MSSENQFSINYGKSDADGVMCKICSGEMQGETTQAKKEINQGK